MLCFLFAALIVALDQFFKHWIMRTLDVGEIGPEVIPGVLGLTRWENDGAMLNILSGQQWLLAGIAFVAAIVLIMILLRYNEGFWGTLGLAAVLGGTVGNLVDRIFNDGKVVDMFRTLFINFPIFNIADIFITLGFITFLIHFITLSFKSDKTARIKQETRYDNEDYYDEYDDDGEYEEFPDIDSVISATSERETAPVRRVREPEYTANEFPEPEFTDLHFASDDDDYYQPEQDDVSENYNTSEYDSITETTDTTFTLDDLESELGSYDDYSVDDILREYGLSDDDSV